MFLMLLTCFTTMYADLKYRVVNVIGKPYIKVNEEKKQIEEKNVLKSEDFIYLNVGDTLEIYGQTCDHLIVGKTRGSINKLIADRETGIFDPDVPASPGAADSVGVREITQQDAKNKPKLVMIYFYDNGRRLFAYVKRYDMDKSVSFEITERENILNHLDSCRASKETKSIYNTPQLYQMLWKNMAQYFKEDDIISYIVPQYLYGIDMRYLPMNEKQRMGHLFYMFSPRRR